MASPHTAPNRRGHARLHTHSPGPWSSPRGALSHGAPAASPTGNAAVYRRRRPTATPLYPIVQHHLESFLAEAAQADAQGGGVPRWVEDDFRAYLRCGILAHGFARIRCDACAAERLVAFSCKGRGVCPSCNARRMVQVAAHLTDHVLPPLPLRQWVLSLTKRIRPFLPRDSDLIRPSPSPSRTSTSIRAAAPEARPRPQRRFCRRRAPPHAPAARARTDPPPSRLGRPDPLCPRTHPPWPLPSARSLT